MFEEWVKEIDRNFDAQKRKITLIIDNCPVHPDIPSLGGTNLSYSEYDVSLKAKYRSLAVKKQIDALEKGNQLPKFSVLTAMSMLTKDGIPFLTED